MFDSISETEGLCWSPVSPQIRIWWDQWETQDLPIGELEWSLQQQDSEARTRPLKAAAGHPE